MKHLKYIYLFTALALFVFMWNSNIADMPNTMRPALPNTGIPGFNFPESETTMNGWVFSSDTQEIYNHAWGIWVGLTTETGKKPNGESLRYFETWLTPGEMKSIINGQLKMTGEKKPSLKLSKPKQFRNKKVTSVMKKEYKKIGPDTDIAVSVSYNPPAANHAVINKLFWASTLKGFLKDGYDDIPNFPVDAITIKPVYKIITKDKLIEGRYYSFPVWPGSPVPAKTFDESTWNSCVYVDLKGEGKGGGKINYGCTGPTPETTYNLSDFIHNRISKEDAEYLSKELSLGKVEEGDYAILVGMHVTSREMKRWAWQTFWWSANPDKPFDPSLPAIAAARPSQLKGAPRHYAMSVAYQMLQPAQPLTGGENIGMPLFAFNPYLEAGFDPSVFQVNMDIMVNDTTFVKSEYGVQTNCMTCHGIAQFNPAPGYYKNPNNRETPYAADFYLDLNNSIFQNNLKVDFAWSIIGNVELDK